MTEQAVVAFRDAQYEEPEPKGTLEAAQTVLRRDLAALKELLPEDFPKSRLGDLSRHIGYCHMHDCLDMAGFDLPDIMAKAEQYVLAQAPREISGEIGNYLHTNFRARLDREMAMSEPDYHALVLKAAIILGDTFKEKTGATDDKNDEIGKALRIDQPTIKVMSNLETETNKNFQRGTMLLLQGVRAFYRNTYAHGQIAASHRNAVHALVIMSMLAEVIDGSERVDC
ncbi:TIGR02391 family protein [Octadecabacter ascidiaceicola]|nr:TIGR02391 family protein [Octadecabacter ascidiaceicola]